MVARLRDIAEIAPEIAPDIEPRSSPRCARLAQSEEKFEHRRVVREYLPLGRVPAGTISSDLATISDDLRLYRDAQSRAYLELTSRTASSSVSATLRRSPPPA